MLPSGSCAKASCSCMVYTWALKGLPYHNFGAYVSAIKLHGAFGMVLASAFVSLLAAG